MIETEKLVKDAIKCENCGNVTKSAEYDDFCDVCNKLTSRENKLKATHLSISVFHYQNSDETKHYIVCGWNCLIKKLKVLNKIKYEFIDIEYIFPKNKVATDELSLNGLLKHIDWKSVMR